LKNTVSETGRSGRDSARVGGGSRLGSSERASIVGNKGAVSILLDQINVVVVDQVLDNDTGRVNNEGIVEVGVIAGSTWT
jgi:hypothetical protein